MKPNNLILSNRGRVCPGLFHKRICCFFDCGNIWVSWFLGILGIRFSGILGIVPVHAENRKGAILLDTTSCTKGTDEPDFLPCCC